MKDMGFQAAQKILKSADPLAFMRDLSQVR